MHKLKCVHLHPCRCQQAIQMHFDRKRKVECMQSGTQKWPPGWFAFLSFVRVAVAKRRFSADLSTLQIKFYHNTCLRFFSSINQLNHQTISRSSLIMEKNLKIQTLPTKSSCTQPFIFQSAWLHSNEFY